VKCVSDGAEIKRDRAKIFARNIRFLRKAVGINKGSGGMSQSDLAEAVGVTRRTVISWESGKLPGYDNLKRMASFFSLELQAEISSEDLLEKDFTEQFEFMPLSDIGREMPHEHKRILKSLFLSARGLDRAQLDKVIEFIATLSEK